MQQSSDPKQARRTFAFRCAATFAAAGALWIALSDVAAAQLPPAAERVAQTFKGWGFVGATTGVLYWAVRRFERRVSAAEREAAAARAALEGRVREQGAE